MHTKGNLNPGGKTCLAQRSFSVVPRDRTRGNGHRLKHRKFRLPRELVESLSLEILRTCLGRVLGNILQPTLLWAGVLD